MNKQARKWLVGGVMGLGLVTLGIRVYLGTTGPSSPSPTSLQTTSPYCGNVPISSTVPISLGLLSEAHAACFMWKTFVALNWPALPGSPVQPDPNAKLGGASPVVWETYKSPNEVFL